MARPLNFSRNDTKTRLYREDEELFTQILDEQDLTPSGLARGLIHEALEMERQRRGIPRIYKNKSPGSYTPKATP